jgi:hypothetical protein
LYFAEGEFTSAVDSTPRRISCYMPITVTTRERSLIVGGPNDEPELYDLSRDPIEQVNIWNSHVGEGRKLAENALAFLEGVGTPEMYLKPRRVTLEKFAPAGSYDNQQWTEKEAG